MIWYCAETFQHKKSMHNDFNEIFIGIQIEIKTNNINL